jgi:hypothetical protein
VVEADDRWILAADAADFLGKRARKRISRRLGPVRLRGARPGERELGDISVDETQGARLDWGRSRIVDGLFTLFVNVHMRWADVERLADALADEPAPRNPNPVDLAGDLTVKVSMDALADALAARAIEAEQPTPAAAGRGKKTVAESGSRGGIKSGESRRAARKWVPHATKLGKAACERNRSASHAAIAREIFDNWRLKRVKCPEHDTLARFVSECRRDGVFPKRSASPQG